MEHGWLWDMFGSKIRPNVMIDDEFDETEDLPEPPPKQELTQPENVIDLPEPDPDLVDDGEFDLGDFDEPPETVEISDDTLRDAIKQTVLQMAEDVTIEAGYAAGFRSEVYSALMAHVRKKFLDGVSLGLAERAELSFAWKMLAQVKKNVSAVPGLIAGIIEYGDQ